MLIGRTCATPLDPKMDCRGVVHGNQAYNMNAEKVLVEVSLCELFGHGKLSAFDSFVLL